MSERTRLLLTGIGGSIGCHTFAHIMTNTDWHVVGIDSFRHKGWTDRITEITRHHPDWLERLTLITHDLTAPLSPVAATKIGPVKFIINMAARSDVEASIEDPAQFIQDNVAVATTMLDFARTQRELAAFVQISTDEVYGPCDPSTSGHVEWSPILPSNPYAASKACQEAIAISYWRSYGVPVIITNTMNNLGELQSSSKYPAILQRKIAAGEVVTVHGTPSELGSRYYLHSRNHADALLFILQHTIPYQHRDGFIDRPDRYNIVGDRRLNNLELAQLVADLMGRELRTEVVDFHKARPGHDRHYGLSGDKLARLGWSSPLSFEESLKNTIAWTAEHPEWA